MLKLTKLEALLQRREGLQGYIVPIVAVGFSLLARDLLEYFGQFYYLPFVPAVMITAILAHRPATCLAVALSILANGLLVERESIVDMTVNALLFVVVSWFIAEMCWRLRTHKNRAQDLSRRLAHRNQMLDAILASVPVVTVDRQARIRFLTDHACAVLGADRDQALSRPITDFVDAYDMGTPQGEAGEDRVWTGRRPDGRTYPLSIQLGVMPANPDGDYATLCLTDLTQVHAADARARDLHTQLNRVWRLNSLGEMAASMAHELNQPLSADTTNLHARRNAMEKAGPVAAGAVGTIDLAKGQLLRAGAIIRRMRELLAHESRSLGVERVAAMMADMQGVIGMIQRSGGVSIEVEIDDLNDQVRVERIQFQQAMLNLVRNAVEALQGRSDGRVRITGRALSPDLFEMRVEDNGDGVDASELDTIFRPLMTTKSAGMGLGLSVTRTIVESHGGTLNVDRSPMGGAAFSFCLMREQDLEDA